MFAGHPDVLALASGERCQSHVDERLAKTVRARSTICHSRQVSQNSNDRHYVQPTSEGDYLATSHFNIRAMSSHISR